MVSTRNELANDSSEPFAKPANRFLTDFTRFKTHFERLTLDINGSANGSQHLRNGNSGGSDLILSTAISTLRSDMRSFLTSLRHFQLLLDSMPIPFLQLDDKARILRTNEK